jgi:hypothetical protein
MNNQQADPEYEERGRKLKELLKGFVGYQIIPFLVGCLCFSLTKTLPPSCSCKKLIPYMYIFCEPMEKQESLLSYIMTPCYLIWPQIHYSE